MYDNPTLIQLSGLPKALPSVPGLSHQDETFITGLHGLIEEPEAEKKPEVGGTGPLGFGILPGPTVADVGGSLQKAALWTAGIAIGAAAAIGAVIYIVKKR